MRKSIATSILFCIFTFSNHGFSHIHDKNLLAIVIMVKNEVDVIIPTLQPFIDAGLQSFLVYDTGSTDGTQHMIRDHLQKSGIADAHIIEEPFIDFGTSRNKALDYAEKLFPHTTFLLMLDA